MKRKDRVERERPRFPYKGEKLLYEPDSVLDFLKTFSLKNEGFGVLKMKNGLS